MIVRAFNTFIDVMYEAAWTLFQLPITKTVSVGSFLAAAAILSVMIGVIFAGIRGFVSFSNDRVRRGKKNG